jgi:thiamine biosynthesis lipoprotein ApbE
MIADAYATTLCVMPWELACEILKKTPEISGVLVRYDGALFQKEGSRSEVFL